MPGGGYLLKVTGQSGIALEADRHRQQLRDTTVGATAHQTGNGTTYLTCRSTGAGTSTGREYTFGVGTNGVWEIQYINAGTHQVKNLATDTSSAIHSGNDVTNTIRADCIGDYLTLFANGTPIYQVYDSTLRRGRLASASQRRPAPRRRW